MWGSAGAIQDDGCNCIGAHGLRCCGAKPAHTGLVLQVAGLASFRRSSRALDGAAFARAHGGNPAGEPVYDARCC